jgi:hypothetical protein
VQFTALENTGHDRVLTLPARSPCRCTLFRSVRAHELRRESLQALPRAQVRAGFAAHARSPYSDGDGGLSPIAAHSGVPSSTHCWIKARSSALTQPGSPGSPPSQPALPEPDSGMPPDSISSRMSAALSTASS